MTQPAPVTIKAQTPPRDGGEVTYADHKGRVNLDTRSPDRAFAILRNDGKKAVTITASPHRKTINVPGFGPAPIPDMVLKVDPGASAIMGPFPPVYAASGGVVTLDLGPEKVEVALVMLAQNP